MPVDATLVDLIEQYQRHLLEFTSLRMRATGTTVEHRALAEHALAALALSSAATADLNAERRHIADYAVRCGVDPAAVAGAMTADPRKAASQARVS